MLLACLLLSKIIKSSFTIFDQAISIFSLLQLKAVLAWLFKSTTSKAELKNFLIPQVSKRMNVARQTTPRMCTNDFGNLLNASFNCHQIVYLVVLTHTSY